MRYEAHYHLIDHIAKVLMDSHFFYAWIDDNLTTQGTEM